MRFGLRWLDRLSGGGDLGLRGERLAERELKRRGYRILARRWRCRLGEIDLVAMDGDVLAVVEVKTRSRSDFGRAVDAVDPRKRRKLDQLARAYVAAKRLGRVTVRFDVVGVELRPGAPARLEVVANAFEARIL